MDQRRLVIHLFEIFFKHNKTNKAMRKILNLTPGAGIWTHDLWIMSLLL